MYAQVCNIPNLVIFLSWTIPVIYNGKDNQFQIQTECKNNKFGNISCDTKFSLQASTSWSPDEVAKYCSNIEKLNNLAELQDNWNGYGAKQFSKNLITRLSKIISILDTQPEIFPTGAQSIQLEYENDNAYLEFEIYESGEIKAYLEANDEGEEKIINEADIKIWLDKYREQ